VGTGAGRGVDEARNVMTARLDALRDRVTITIPEAAELLGIGRSAAYECARRGEIPTLRLGARLVVPVPKVLAMLGADDDDSG
jgi:excisionase family DNA binding protein